MNEPCSTHNVYSTHISHETPYHCGLCGYYANKVYYLEAMEKEKEERLKKVVHVLAELRQRKEVNQEVLKSYAERIATILC